MDYQAMEDYLPRAKGSVYKLVRMAASRALELADGRRPMVETPLATKLTTIALQEIRDGKLEIKGANSIKDKGEQVADKKEKSSEEK